MPISNHIKLLRKGNKQPDHYFLFMAGIMTCLRTGGKPSKNQVTTFERRSRSISVFAKRKAVFLFVTKPKHCSTAKDLNHYKSKERFQD